MGARGQEIALSNEHDTSPLPTSPSTPSPGKGDRLEMMHSADTVLHLLRVQTNQVSLQNSLCKALARVRFQNSSRSHLLTVFTLNLPEKELPPKNQSHSTQFPKRTASSASWKNLLHPVCDNQHRAVRRSECSFKNLTTE